MKLKHFLLNYLLTSSLITCAFFAVHINTFAHYQKGVKTNEPIVVYSARKEHLIKPLFDEFTKETGIKVKYFTGQSGALIERLKLEGTNTKADILLTVDAGNLWYASTQGILRPIESDYLASTIPSYLKDEDENMWVGLSVRARTIVYHTERILPSQLSSYADLADPKWRGRLCLRSAKKIYNKSLVAAMIYHFGKPETEKIIRGWVGNLATKPHAKDAQVMSAILSGQCDVGIVNTYYFAHLLKKEANTPLKLFWADEEKYGTHINISGAGISKYAPHPEGAKYLIEWLSSAKAQKIYANFNNEYPANQNILPNDEVLSWGDFKHDTIPLIQVGRLQAEAVKLMQLSGYY